MSEAPIAPEAPQHTNQTEDVPQSEEQVSDDAAVDSHEETAEPEKEAVPTEKELELTRLLEAAKSELAITEKKIDENTHAEEHAAQMKQQITTAYQTLDVEEEALADVLAQIAELDAFTNSRGDLDAIERALEAAEDCATQEILHDQWAKTTQEDDIQSVDVASLNTAELLHRIAAADQRHSQHVHQSNQLLCDCERAKNQAMLLAEENRAKLTSSFEKEKAELLETRKYLKSLETEQQFHIRRGTYIKDVPPPPVKDVDVAKQADIESQTAAEIVAERERLEVLTDDVRALRKDAEQTKIFADAKRKELCDSIADAKQAAEEMEWERELLLIEREDLAAVKKELIALTAAVKQQRKN